MGTVHFPDIDFCSLCFDLSILALNILAIFVRALALQHLRTEAAQSYSKAIALFEKLADWFDFAAFVETNCLKTDMCKSESSQSWKQSIGNWFLEGLQ